MDRQALLSMLEDLAPSELFEGVEGAQSTKELLPLLDAELQRSSNRMQRIQEYRNKLSSPMYSLLPELLSKIFMIYATDGHELFNMRWSRLLLVCRRWYDVGISTPMLWSHISLLDSPSPTYQTRGTQADQRIIKRIKAQLARAGGSPLTIKAGSSAYMGGVSDVLRPYQSVWWDPNMLKGISLSGDKDHVSSLLRGMASHQHPILTNLEVAVSPPGLRSFMAHPPSVPSSTPAVALPDGLLGDDAPQLYSLTLDGVRPNWALIRNLRVLYTTFDDTAAPSTSLESIADALGRCPLLEDLRMMLPQTFRPADTRLSTTISLKHLNKVIMRGNADVCAGLLQAFEGLPPSARISLVAPSPSSVQEISLLSSILGTHNRQDDTPAIHGVSVTTSPALIQNMGANMNVNLDMLNGQAAELRAVQLCVSGSTYLDRHPPLDIPIAMKISGAIYTSLSVVPKSETTAEIALGHVLQSWQLTGATFLDVRACRIMSVAMWRVLFDNVPSATKVVLLVDSPSLTSLLELLSSSLRAEKRRLVRNIILDLGDVGRSAQVSFLIGAAAGAAATQMSPSLRASLNLIRVLQYCSEAAQAGVALDTIELVNDDMQTQAAKRIIQTESEVDWSELYHDLSEGFVYEGVLHNATTGSKGIERDSFTGPKLEKETQVLLRSLFY